MAIPLLPAQVRYGTGVAPSKIHALDLPSILTCSFGNLAWTENTRCPSIGSLIQTQGIGDLYRIYSVTQRDEVDYNLAYIPEAFNAPHKEEFDTEYMRALFKLGYEQASKGYPWAKQPPGM